MKRHILGGIEHLSMSVWIKEHCHQNNFNGVEYSKFANIDKNYALLFLECKNVQKPQQDSNS